MVDVVINVKEGSSLWVVLDNIKMFLLMMMYMIVFGEKLGEL